MSASGGQYETSFRSSPDVSVEYRQEPSRDRGFLSFLAVAQSLKVDILPLTWDAGRKDIGFGATATILEALVNIHIRFAFKRANKEKTESEIFRCFTNEIAVLSHSLVREHPNIAQLQGICWEIAAIDDKPWPVLVFEKSSLKDLYSFAKTPAGISMTFSQRLKLCVDIGTAIMDMHSVQIVHGDLKPENVLIFPNNQDFTARVTDFGYSTRYAHEGDTISLAISHPWNAPEVNRLNRDWTPARAKKADLFSFGMLCLWILFPAQLSQSVKSDDGTIALAPLTEGSADSARGSLTRLKDDQKLQDFAQNALESVADIKGEDLTALSTLLSSCLSTNPLERLVSIRETWGQLEPERLKIINSLDTEEDWQVPERYFKLDRSTLQLYQSDYRVRRYITQRLIEACKRDGSYSLQVAFCYLTGFGVSRDLQKVQETLQTHNQSMQELLQLMIEDIQRKEPERPSTMAKLINSGDLPISHFVHIYLTQNRAGEAERSLRQEMDDLLDFHGDNNPMFTAPGSALFELYAVQCRWKEAGDVLLKVLASQRAREGENGKSTMTSKANMATVYVEQGQLDEAESLQRELLEANRSNLGHDHSDTLTDLANLALNCKKQGKWPEAEAYYTEAVSTGKRKLGPEHYQVLTWTHNLAGLYQAQGQWKQAVDTMKAVIDARKKTLGKEHPDTVQSMGNLASFYCDQRLTSEAITLQQQVLEIHQRTMGDSHSDTVTQKGNLAVMLCNLQQFDQAEILQLEVLNTRKQYLGVKHPLTLASMSNLADVYRDEGKLQEAENLQREELEIAQSVFNQQHPSYLNSQGQLALILEEAGRLDEAEGLINHVLQARKLVLGPEHPHTLSTMSNLVWIWVKRGQYQPALEHMEEIYQVRLRLYGSEHKVTKACLFAMDMIRTEQERAREAKGAT